jgi:hypothetical protein
MVRNWPAYKAGLHRRCSLTVWIEDAALECWQTMGPSGQARYTNAAIQTSLTKRRRCHTVGSPHRPASLLSRSVAGGEAWREVAPEMAKAGTWHLAVGAASGTLTDRTCLG